MKLPIGKLPAELLKKIVFKHKGLLRDDVIIGPGIGIDSAIMRSKDEFIVATTDPITAAPKLLGTLSVYITTNDLIACGSLPKWFLPTILLPKNATTELLTKIVEDMNKAAKELNMSIVGGHTEVTPYLDLPIIISTAIGTTNKFITAANVKPGDVLVMTKSAGMEGTAVIAYEYDNKLLKMKMTKNEIKLAKKMIFNTSIYLEGKILFNKFKEKINALHDPTEGGVFTAVYEMAEASNMGVKLYKNRIPVDPITQKITEKMKLNPYYLLSSGSLLISTDKETANKIKKEMKTHNIICEIIGEFTEETIEREIYDNGHVYKLIKREKDEIWKIFK